MDHSARVEASKLLHGIWQSRATLVELPEELRPGTREEGYAIQAELLHREASSLFGWKIAATSTAGQQHINVSGPLAGRLLSSRIRRDGATISLSGNQMRVAEIEFAFRMASTLPPRGEAYSLEEVRAATGSLHPAIEIPDSRFSDFTAVGAAQIIADNACADLFVLGPATSADWRAADLAGHVVKATVNQSPPLQGIGANALGDPWIALTWIANELSRLGTTLDAGAVVTTGTCMAPIAVRPGDHVVGNFGVFGNVSVSFTD